MLRKTLFASLLTIGLTPAGLFGQEAVQVVNAVEIKKERPPATRYEALIKTPGKVVVSKKYAVGDPSLRMFARVSYRENTPALKILTLEDSRFSVDADAIPTLVNDLEKFIELMKAAEGKEGEDVWFRFADDFYANFYSYGDDKGGWRQNLVFHAGTQVGQGAYARERLNLFIEGLKQGHSKLQELNSGR